MQKGEYLVCNNCGNRFLATQVELIKGGCNPVPITRELKRVADQHASGRIVSTLEGGYNLSALGRSAVAHVDALLGH